MSDFDQLSARGVPVDRADMSVDAGLRSFMLGVYNKLALGLLLSAVLAYITSSVPAVQALLYRVTADGVLAGYTPIGWVVAFSPLVLILGSSFLMKNVTPRNSGMLYWAIVSLIGASMGSLVLMYTGASIASTFLITASAFGVLSLVGYTTKRDLSPLGSFLIMGVWGLLLASLVNAFILKSPIMHTIVSYVGVLIFAGLIAYDTQKLKMTYYAVRGDEASMGVATNYGALNLYLDFINLFQFLMSILGDRR